MTAAIPTIEQEQTAIARIEIEQRGVSGLGVVTDPHVLADLHLCDARICLGRAAANNEVGNDNGRQVWTDEAVRCIITALRQLRVATVDDLLALPLTYDGNFEAGRASITYRSSDPSAR